MRQYNKTLRHFIKNQKKYLFPLLIIILAIPIILNLLKNKPLLMGSETYYHLNYLPTILHFWFLPLILATLTLIIFYLIAKKKKFSKQFTFFFILLLLLSPIFIYTYSTFSAYALFTFLAALGFYLLLQENYLRHLSIIPFILATFIDIFSSIIILLIIIIQLIKKNKHHVLLALTILSILANIIFLKQPFFLGPFHIQHLLPDLISDLGGLSGISLFTLLLALIGIATTWRTKEKFLSGYWFLLLLIPAYIYTTQIIFYVGLLTAFFASIGLINILERKWAIKYLKDLTTILLIVSILFSSLTFLERISENGPTKETQEVLEWIKEHEKDDAVIFSTLDNSYFIPFFANREAFQYPHQKEHHLTVTVLNSTYTQTTFPILDQKETSHLFIEPQTLSKDQGLLFLLKNERFKLIHESENYEVWKFKRER